MATFKEESKQNWNGQRTYETINAGSFQRIADSLERIEKPYLDLIRRNEYLENRNKDLRKAIESCKRSNTSLKGWITRLKNK
jgi:hypothetical protein